MQSPSGAEQLWGAARPAWVRCLPRACWELGNGKDPSVGRQECPSHSALLGGDVLSPGVALRESTGSWGWFFGCLVLLGVEKYWGEVKFPAPLPKMKLGAGTSLVHPQLPGGFSVLFLLFFFFFPSPEKAAKSKRRARFNKN